MKYFARFEGAQRLRGRLSLYQFIFLFLEGEAAEHPLTRETPCTIGWAYAVCIRCGAGQPYGALKASLMSLVGRVRGTPGGYALSALITHVSLCRLREHATTLETPLEVL